jgi:hypothetical protein
MKVSHIQALKRAVSTYAPPLFWAIRHSRRILHKGRNDRLQNGLAPWKAKFIRDFGFVVQSGPFSGMTFHSSTVPETYLPMLTGSYEAQTHGFIESALARDPSVIIDVGCEAGYVAVGLARRAPRAQIYGFDIDAGCRAKTAALARLNRVGNVIVESECTPERLDALCSGRPLVFCDCEGYEFDLLDPVKAPNLAGADIIVELHDFMRTDVDITPTIEARFAATHDIELVGVGTRAPQEYPCLADFPESVRGRALRENRIAYQQWAFLRTKAH